MYLGHDVSSNTYYSGKIAYVRVVIGENAYKADNKFDKIKDDPFGFDIGFTKLVTDEVEDKEPPKPTDEVYESGFDIEKPVIEKERDNLS